MRSASKLRCMIVFGTRPEAIKIAPIALAMRAAPDRFECQLVFTGQQRELGRQALAMFGLSPDVDLDLMMHDQGLSAFFGRAIAGVDRLLADRPPDWLIVQGDTGTVLAAALAAYYRRIPVAHVEAGLRTHDIVSPHPEEGNRQLVSRIAALHFAPVERSRRNLIAEGIGARRIVVTGNTSIDALHWMRDRLAAREAAMPETIGPDAPAGRLVLATLHRRESFGAPLSGMLEAIRDLARDATLGLTFLMPVHPNPQVGGPIREALGREPNIRLVPPLDYAEMLGVLQRSWLVMTDSGGLQEEAPSFGVPVLVLRDVSDRPESIEAGVAQLVGTDRPAIVDAVIRLSTDAHAHTRMRADVNPYGDGNAARLILDRLSMSPGDDDA